MEARVEKKIINKLDLCEVCENSNSIYSCPRCETKSCSLTCINQHKKELNCNGERNKTAYKALSKFNNLDLLSDYRLLEDISRVIETCKRNPMKRSTQKLPRHLHQLKTELNKRGTRMDFLPQHFTRHKDNTTKLDFKTNIIFWKLELIFPQGGNIKIIESNVDENVSFAKILAKYFNPKECPEKYNKYLKFYQAAGLSDVEILLKAEKVRPPEKCYSLDMSLSLKNNLANKLVIEYPIIYIVRKSHVAEYDVITLTEDEFILPDNKKTIKMEYKPFHFFDTMNYEKPGDASAASIHSSVKELKHFMCPENDDLSDTESEGEPEEVQPKKRKGIFIPNYHDL